MKAHSQHQSRENGINKNKKEGYEERKRKKKYKREKTREVKNYQIFNI